MSSYKVSAALSKLREIDQKYRAKKFEESESSNDSSYANLISNDEKVVTPKPMESPRKKENKMSIKIPMVDNDSVKSESESFSSSKPSKSISLKKESLLDSSQSQSEDYESKNNSEILSLSDRIEEEIDNVRSGSVEESIIESISNVISESIQVELDNVSEKEKSDTAKSVKSIESDYEETFEEESSTSGSTSGRSDTEEEEASSLDAVSDEKNDEALHSDEFSRRHDDDNHENDDDSENNRDVFDKSEKINEPIVTNISDDDGSKFSESSQLQKKDETSVSNKNIDPSSSTQITSSSMKEEKDKTNFLTTSEKNHRETSEDITEDETPIRNSNEKIKEAITSVANNEPLSSSDNKSPSSNINRQDSNKTEGASLRESSKATSEQEKRGVNNTDKQMIDVDNARAKRKYKKEKQNYNVRAHIHRMNFIQEKKEFRSATRNKSIRQKSLSPLDFTYLSNCKSSDENKITDSFNRYSSGQYSELEHRLLNIRRWLKTQLNVYRRESQLAAAINANYVPTTLEDTKKMIRQMRKTFKVTSLENKVH